MIHFVGEQSLTEFYLPTYLPRQVELQHVFAYGLRMLGIVKSEGRVSGVCRGRKRKAFHWKKTRVEDLHGVC